jgi:hypothetical protein
MATPSGDPVVSAKDFGRGRVVLVATTASREWGYLSQTPLLLAMVQRICLEAGDRQAADRTFPAGALVEIRPEADLPEGTPINVTGPRGQVHALPLERDAAGPVVRFTETSRPGLYEWQADLAAAEVPAAGLGAERIGGSFAVNIDGAETDLAEADRAAVARAVEPAPVFIADSLDAAHQAAADAAAGDNLWDRVIAIVILLLIVEAVVANRLRRGSEPIPAHLNPRLADADRQAA